MDAAMQHPRYGKPVSAKTFNVEGLLFRVYRRSIGQTIRVSDDLRIEVYSNAGSISRLNRATHYRAVVDGVLLPTKFQTEARAYKVALATARGGK